MNTNSTAAAAAAAAAAITATPTSAAVPRPLPYEAGGALVTVLNANDVLLGRGAPVIDNEGNMRFRQIVHTRRAEYLASTRRQEKDWIARQVMTAIRSRGGRFLRKIEAESQQQLNLPEGAPAWTVVDEEAVLLKVKQAMRDRSLEDEEPRARRRRRVKSNNVVLDEDLSIEEEKRTTKRSRNTTTSTDEAPSLSSRNQHHHTSSVAQLAQAGLLLQAAGGGGGNQQHQPRNQQQSTQAHHLVDFLLQQQQLQGHQQQSMMLAELQRQQHERQMAQLIEEHRLRNSFGLQGVSALNHHHATGNFGVGTVPSLRDMPASLGGGGGSVIGGISGGLPDIATLARLHSSSIEQQQQPGNLSMQQASLNLNTTKATATAPISSAASPISGQTTAAGGQAYAMAATASLARRSSAGSSQASTTAAGQQGVTAAQPDDDNDDTITKRNIITESSGDFAIGHASDRMNKKPGGGGALLHNGGQYLKISLIEGCLLSVICSFGIPQCWSAAASDDIMAGMFTSSSKESQEGKTTSFTWADLSNLVQKKVGKLKSGVDQAEEEPLALATTASSNPALTSSAAVLAESFTKDPKELARMTIMLLEKMKIHSRIEHMQNAEHFTSSNGEGSRGHQDYLLWQHLSAELAKWATLLDVANEGTDRPIAHSLCDVTPKNLAVEEVVTPVGALDMANSRTILVQAACLSRLKSIFQRQSSQEITDALKHTSTKQHMAWVSRPTWWLQHDKESITRDVWLLEKIVIHGLVSILDVPIPSKLFPVTSLRDAGFTKAVIKHRVIQLTVAIHEHVQTKKRVQVVEERASKLSVMMGQEPRAERSDSM